MLTYQVKIRLIFLKIVLSFSFFFLKFYEFLKSVFIYWQT